MKALEHNKTFKSLCKEDQKKLIDIAMKEMKNIAYETYEDLVVGIQEVWIKTALVMLGGTFDFDETKLYIFLQNWGHQYRWLNTLNSNEERIEKLDEQLKEFFPGGFPQEFMDYLKKK